MKKFVGLLLLLALASVALGIPSFFLVSGGAPRGAARSINFAGSTAVIIPHSSSISPTTAASIFAWVKTTDTSNNLGIFAKSNYTENKRCLALETWGNGISPRGLAVVSSDGSTVNSIYGEDAINDGAWHHVGFTYSAGTVWNYWNAIREDGQTVLTANTINSLNQDATTEWTIGSLLNGNTPALNFVGKIFCPVTTNTALTAAQVAELFNHSADGRCRVSDLSFASSIKAAYAFDNRDSLASVKDDSGNANHGTYNGSLSDYSTDVPSGRTIPAYGLVNTDQDGARYISVAHSTSTNFSTAMTAMIWVKNATTGEQVFFGKADFGQGKRSWFMENSFRGGNVVELFLSSNGANNHKDYQSSIDLGTSDWASAAFTYDAGVTKLYINGVEDTAVTKHSDVALASLYQDTGTVTLVGAGRSNGSIALPFKGSIDRPLLFNRALTAAEILSIHNAYTAKTDFSASITGNVLNLALNKGIGLTSFPDLSGSSNTATPTGYLVTDWVTGVY